MSDLTMSVRAHPSAAHRWVGAGCLGSIQLEARYEDHETSWSLEGDKAHDLGARLLRGEDLELPIDFAQVRVYVDEVNRYRAQRPGAEFFVEEERSWALHPELQGTPDAVLIDHERKHVTIWDLKWGWGVVEVLNNFQLLSYALLVTPTKYTTEVCIVQPRPYHRDGPVRAWIVDWKTLQLKAVKIAKALKAAVGGDETLKPGAHCRYCKALHACKAARRLTLELADAVTGPEEVPNSALAAELRAMREAAELVQLRTGALEELVAAKLSAGEQIPGAALVEGKGGRKVWGVADDIVRNTLLTLTGKDFATAKMPTPTQLKNAGVDPAMLEPLVQYNPGKTVVDLSPDAVAQAVFEKEEK